MPATACKCNPPHSHDIMRAASYPHPHYEGYYGDDEDADEYEYDSDDVEYEDLYDDNYEAR